MAAVTSVRSGVRAPRTRQPCRRWASRPASASRPRVCRSRGPQAAQDRPLVGGDGGQRDRPGQPPPRHLGGQVLLGDVAPAGLPPGADLTHGRHEHTVEADRQAGVVRPVQDCSDGGRLHPLGGGEELLDQEGIRVRPGPAARAPTGRHPPAPAPGHLVTHETQLHERLLGVPAVPTRTGRSSATRTAAPTSAASAPAPRAGRSPGESAAPRPPGRGHARPLPPASRRPGDPHRALRATIPRRRRTCATLDDDCISLPLPRRTRPQQAGWTEPDPPLRCEGARCLDPIDTPRGLASQPTAPGSSAT